MGAMVKGEVPNPIASAVVKPGHHSKFCHLRIDEGSQDTGLGELFFTLMTLDVRDTAKEIHFTLPESLWEKRSGFFKSFGFAERVEAGTQYRLFERELCCSAPFQTVWRSTQAKLPRVASRLAGVDPVGDTVLFSLKPQWADAILEGRKRVEIRRAFSRRWAQGQAFLYAGAPVQRIVGEARVANVTEGPPAEIWKQYGLLMGATFEEFEAYTKGAATVFAILLENPRKYVPALSMTELRTMVDAPLRPPMSYANLASSPAWANAVSLAAVLGTPIQGPFGMLANR